MTFGESWEKRETLNESVRVLYIKDDKTFYAGTESGFFITTDKMETWEKRANEFKDFAVPTIEDIIADKEGSIYLVTYFGGIYKSTDQGLGWFPSNNGYTDSLVECFAFDSKGNIYAATYGVFKSSDRGNMISYL